MALLDENFDELVYLVSKGDKKAVEVAVRTIGLGVGGDVVAYDEPLIMAAYEKTDSQQFFESLSKNDNEAQLRVLVLCDHLWYERQKLVDWDGERDDYLAKNNELRELYELRCVPRR